MTGVAETMPRGRDYRSPLENTEEERNNNEIGSHEKRKNRVACTRRTRWGSGRDRDGRKRWTEESKQIYRARLKSCGGVVFVGVASVLRPLAENMLRSRNEITTRKRDSPRLPSGQIRISSGDKPVRDSVHRSWTFRISFLLATGLKPRRQCICR